MSKMKVHSGAAKRFKKTAAGYILTKMTTKRKRHLRGTSIVDKADQVHVDRLLRL